MKRLIIIGAGAAGSSAALMAAEQGCQVTLIEKEKLGGECVHRGCVPAKKYLRAAALFMETGVRPDAGMLRQETEELIGKIRYGIGYQLKKSGVQIKYGEAEIMAPGVVALPGERLEADGIFIATGSAPFLPEGIVLPQEKASMPQNSNHLREDRNISQYDMYSTDDMYMYSMDAMFTDLTNDIQERNNANLCVLGAGAVGTEAAVIFSMLGAKVTLVEQAEYILPAMDREVGERLGIWMEERGIHIKTGCSLPSASGLPGDTLSAVGLHGDISSTGDLLGDLSFDDRFHSDRSASHKILICCGRTPVLPACVKDVLLQRTAQGGIRVNEWQETSCRGIYAIGDCTGIRMEANIAKMQAERAVKHFLANSACDASEGVNNVCDASEGANSVCNACEGKNPSGQKDRKENCAFPRIWQKTPFSVIPRCVYTPVEALSAGVTAQEISSWREETGEELAEASAEMEALAAGMIRKEEGGFCKVYFAKDSRKIRGVHLFCRDASLLSPFVQQILTEEMTLDMVRRMPYLHPTVAEIFAELRE